MAAPRPFALVRTADQWLRATHTNTSLDIDGGVVGLAWNLPGSSGAATGGWLPGPAAGGLAFDQECRLYHSLPGKDQVERLRWAAPAGQEAVESLFPAAAPPPTMGQFQVKGAARPPLSLPTALAVDSADRLWIAETGGRAILVYDLWSWRLLRRLDLATLPGEGPRPLDLAADGLAVWVLLDSAPWLLRLEARRDPEVVLTAVSLEHAVRLAIRPGDGPASGRLFALRRDPAVSTVETTVVPLDPAIPQVTVQGGTDLEFQPDGTLVVARLPGDDFYRARLVAGSAEEEPPLKARGYDGLGIVRTPDGRIGFWTDYGFRHAIGARLRYARKGQVSTYRLDSGRYQTTWGRVFLDACIPEGTEVLVRCVTADEMPDGDKLELLPPSNITYTAPRRLDLSPPLLPTELDVGEVDGRLHRRASGRELPWTRSEDAADSRFETYETPVHAPAGRYLWVTLELRGDMARSPRVRSLRVEYPAHDWLQRLPRTYSRDEESADFLLRYLGILEGLYGELEGKSSARRTLLDPRSTPSELLPWLASLVGLVLDERWPADKQRTLLREIVPLFRLRGTIWSLRRMIEIYTDAQVIILEHFRLRGVGGPVLGAGPSQTTRSVLGSGFRIGGAVGVEGQQQLDAGSPEAAFRSRAHRFTVLVAAPLTSEQREVVAHILRVHRPAHTIVDFCTMEAGMRVGRGLLLGLASVVGPTGGFADAAVGQWALGRGAVLGRAQTGLFLEGSRLGGDSRVG